jgi:hypothetical protein
VARTYASSLFPVAFSRSMFQLVSFRFMSPLESN